MIGQSHSACPNTLTTNRFPSSNNPVCSGRFATKWTPISIRVRVLPHSLRSTPLSQLPRLSTMDPKGPQRQKRRDNTLSLLKAAIEAMNLAKEVSSATPAKAVFGSVSILLTMIVVRLRVFLRRQAPGSRRIRTRWPTNLTTSNSGWPAPMYVRFSTGG